ncbi:MAG TPA: gliding motility-associated C-terminal domain-containing protein [Chitinophagaceae bacterium]
MNQKIKIVSIFLLLTFSFLAKTSAQLCQGSLGDPVVNITFGSGVNPGPALSSLTNYNFVSNDCPNDGNYTIANATNNCFNSTWHSLSEDHTPGDTNGYMMVVNASVNPGDFFVKTVDGLCPNTTYEFASWILNVLKPSSCGGAGNKPNITFNIETTFGTILQSYKTGDIPSSSFPEWRQYGFFFSTATTINSVVLRMTNNAPGGCGNDLLLDDITFRACGPLVTANIVGAPDSVDICEGNNSIYTLNANVSAGYTGPVYQWQVSTNNGASWTNIAGANDTTFVRTPVTTPGTYLYRFSVSQRSNINISSCAIISNVIVISVNKFPVVAASNKGSCSGDTLFLNANDGILFSWSGPMNFTSVAQSPFIPAAVSGNSGTYFVKVTSDKGCVTNDSTIAIIIAKPVVNAGSDEEICEGTPVQLNSTGSNITSYQWSPSSGISNANIPNPVALPKQTTLYILTVANNNCRSSDSLMIVVNKLPRADAGSDKVIIDGQSVVLNGAANGTDVSYTWTPIDYLTGPGTLTPTVSPPANQIYTLHVTSNKGCGTATDDVLVKVYKKLFVPNAFTPNNDGINDTWHIETLDAYPDAEVKVFNRYGQLVFDNHGINKPWDGKFKGTLISPGAYVYTIDLKNNSQLIKGIVLIIL